MDQLEREAICVVHIAPMVEPERLIPGWLWKGTRFIRQMRYPEMHPPEWTVRVRPRGRKTASDYHVRFWAPVRKPTDRQE